MMPKSFGLEKYDFVLKEISEYMEKNCMDGEAISVDASVNHRNPNMILITYNTIRNKKHIYKIMHLPIEFLNELTIETTLVVLDDILTQWRGSE